MERIPCSTAGQGYQFSHHRPDKWFDLGVMALPPIFFAAELFEYSDAPAWFALPSFTLVIVVVSVIIAWLRLKTRSLWPAVILHASNNNFNSGFLGDLTSSSGTAPYIVTEVGVGLLLAWRIVAYLFWRRRTELPMASAPLIAL